MTDANPVTVLESLGVTDTPWARKESSRIDSSGIRWDYVAPFVTTQSLRDMALLTTEGWNVHIGSRPDGLHVSIRPIPLKGKP
ncbi:hypothetical protein [Microbacterium sp. P02]|uniref:hypothetical protein n=1 Tax=Microbacterium sp. P02 TaxID=3366260 RepID=UPI00366EC269